MPFMRHIDKKTEFWKCSLEHDRVRNLHFVCCPYCGKRNFPVNHGARIFNLVFKCRGSNCKREFLVNIKTCETGGIEHE